MKVLVKRAFKIIHKYIGVGRRTNSSHDTALYFYVAFTIEYEVV